MCCIGGFVYLRSVVGCVLRLGYGNFASGLAV